MKDMLEPTTCVQALDSVELLMQNMLNADTKLSLTNQDQQPQHGSNASPTHTVAAVDGCRGGRNVSGHRFTLTPILPRLPLTGPCLPLSLSVAEPVATTVEGGRGGRNDGDDWFSHTR